MAAFRSFFLVAALAGLIAGVFITLIHQVGTVPIILKAETYETAGEAPAAAPAGHDHAAGTAEHEHGGEAWTPQDGFERTAYTLLADILTGIGFALLLVAAYALRGGEVNWRHGLFWGLAGFATFTLAPGLGLPPEVPGTEAAPLFERQVWWVLTALATAGGLALIFLTRNAIAALAGVVLLVLPHAWGAPQPAEFSSLAPEALAHDFIVAAVVTSLLFWVVLGSVTGFLYQRFRPTV